MTYSEEDILSLESEVKARLSAHRFAHTLGVVEMAEKLSFFFPGVDTSEIKAAAFLHDVTKEVGYDEQIFMCKSNGLKLTDEDYASKEVLHSLSAEAVIKKDFPLFATKQIIDAVKYHTLASADMNTFAQIIYISDYIETGRAHWTCIKTREKLISSLTPHLGSKENDNVLNSAIIYSIENTAEYLITNGKTIHSQTLEAKKALESKLLH